MNKRVFVLLLAFLVVLSMFVLFGNSADENIVAIAALPTVDTGIVRIANPYTDEYVLPTSLLISDDPFVITSSKKMPLTVQFGAGICFGNCPAYTILILFDGSVYFDGWVGTLDDDVHKVELSTGQLNELKDKILKADFFEIDIQTGYISDVSYNYLSIGWDEQTKSMIYVSGQDLSNELYDLQCYIHTMAESEKWVGHRDWSCARLEKQTGE